MSKKTLFKVLSTSLFSLLLISNQVLAYNQVCVVESDKEILLKCVAGDILVIPPSYAPVACDYKKEFIELKSNQMMKTGVTPPISCVYTGKVLEIRR